MHPNKATDKQSTFWLLGQGSADFAALADARSGKGVPDAWCDGGKLGPTLL